MSKGLAKAAMVIGAVALVIGSAGVLAPVATATALTSVGITASAAALATGLGLASAVLSTASAMTARKPRGGRSTFTPYREQST